MKNNLTPMKWYKVKVTFVDGSTFEDEIRGKNREHAYKRACWNWEEAIKIEIIE